MLEWGLLEVNCAVLGIGTSPQRSVPFVFVLFVLLVMLIVNGTSAYILTRLRSDLDAELDRHLTGVASVIGRQMSWRTVSRFVHGDETGREYQGLIASLEEIRRRFDILDLTVLDPSNKTLFSLTQKIGSDNPVLALDEEELSAAWSGQARATLVSRVGGFFVKRAYAPVHMPDGAVGAVVEVQTDVDFYRSLGYLSSTVWALTLLSLVAIAVLGLLFRRVLRYLVEAGESLQRADKLAIIGKLAATVTHEIRNPLGIMSTALELAQRQVKHLGLADAKLDGLQADIASEITRLNAIVERFLDLARSPASHSPVFRQRVELGTLVRGTGELAAAQVEKEGIRMSIEVQEPGMIVDVDPARIRQLLLNLLFNARDAVLTAGERRIRLAALAGPGPRDATLQVEDSGPGIDPSVGERLFEPFVTTKDTGSGIGLAVVKNIVDEHQGTIQVSSKPGQGTTFTVVLPVRIKG